MADPQPATSTLTRPGDLDARAEEALRELLESVDRRRFDPERYAVADAEARAVLVELGLLSRPGAGSIP